MNESAPKDILSPGSVIVLPGNTHHFHWAESYGYVVQIYGIGPLSIDYIHLSDDPRRIGD